jgi:hypothetical protein
VSFADWVKNGWLVAHKSSKQEIANLLGIVARDLKDSQAKEVSRSDYILNIFILMSYQKSAQISSTALEPA